MTADVCKEFEKAKDDLGNQIGKAFSGKLNLLGSSSSTQPAVSATTSLSNESITPIKPMLKYGSMNNSAGSINSSVPSYNQFGTSRNHISSTSSIATSLEPPIIKPRTLKKSTKESIKNKTRYIKRKVLQDIFKSKNDQAQNVKNEKQRAIFDSTKFYNLESGKCLKEIVFDEINEHTCVHVLPGKLHRSLGWEGVIGDI